jgi:hypothetical protein
MSLRQIKLDLCDELTLVLYRREHLRLSKYGDSQYCLDAADMRQQKTPRTFLPVILLSYEK